MNKFICSVLLIIIIPTSVLASGVSSQITYPAPIPGGRSLSLYLKVDRLSHAFSYNVNCHYDISRNNREFPLRIFVNNETEYPFSFGELTVEPKTSKYLDLPVSEGDLTIAVSLTQQTPEQNFRISNIDSLDTVFNLQACYATEVGGESLKALG